MDIIEKLNRMLQELDNIQKSLDRIKANIRMAGTSVLIRIRPKT